jgi:biopolymer transport protein ExbB/TolQ
VCFLSFPVPQCAEQIARRAAEQVAEERAARAHLERRLLLQQRRENKSVVVQQNLSLREKLSYTEKALGKARRERKAVKEQLRRLRKSAGQGESLAIHESLAILGMVGRRTQPGRSAPPCCPVRV